jgi:hypothetical protein
MWSFVMLDTSVLAKKIQFSFLKFGTYIYVLGTGTYTPLATRKIYQDLIKPCMMFI